MPFMIVFCKVWLNYLAGVIKKDKAFSQRSNLAFGLIAESPSAVSSL
jgi:hypothetical protein